MAKISRADIFSLPREIFAEIIARIEPDQDLRNFACASQECAEIIRTSMREILRAYSARYLAPGKSAETRAEYWRELKLRTQNHSVHLEKITNEIGWFYKFSWNKEKQVYFIEGVIFVGVNRVSKLLLNNFYIYGDYRQIWDKRYEINLNIYIGGVLVDQIKNNEMSFRNSFHGMRLESSHLPILNFGPQELGSGELEIEFVGMGSICGAALLNCDGEYTMRIRNHRIYNGIVIINEEFSPESGKERKPLFVPREQIRHRDLVEILEQPA